MFCVTCCMAKNMTKPKGGEQQETIKWWPIILVLAIILGVGVWTGFSQYYKIKSTPLKNNRPNTTLATSTEEVLAAVGKLILLPTEQPNLAIIDDSVSDLKAKEPFFKDALPGDRILVYSERAIIYRPSQNIIINVGPISVVKTADNQEPWTIEIRNGSKVKGAASKMADSLKTDSLFQVQAAANAFNDNYQGNQLVNFSGKDVTEIAKKFNATVLTELPTDEATSTATLILILGN